MRAHELTYFIKTSALQLGFDACGIAKAGELKEDAAYLTTWLADGNQGDMHFLERNFEKRTDPRLLSPGCRSVVVLLLNYFPEKQQLPDAPQIARYAYSATDYHYVLKEKLRQLEQQIVGKYGPEIVSPEFQHSFVDSAPVLERRWAQRAGLGWIGKNKMLINEGLGSFVFIAVLLINEEAEYDTPTRPRCGSCTRCIDGCPTKALSDSGMNARRCLSYLTIESKHDIEEEFRPMLSNRALGCDICADVCPWNKKWAHPHRHPEMKPAEEKTTKQSFLDWTVSDWQALSTDKFNEVFAKSAVKRAGYNRLKQTIQLLKKPD